MGGENLLFNDHEINGEYELYEVLETDIPGLYENTWGYKFCTPKYLQKCNMPYQIRGTAFRGYQKRLSNLTVFDVIYYGYSYRYYNDGVTIRMLPSNKNMNPTQFKEIYWKKDVYVAEYDLEQSLCKLFKHILPSISPNNKIDYGIISLKDFQKKSQEIFGETYCVIEQSEEFILASLIKEIISEWMRYGNTNHIAECEIKKRIFAKIISSEY
ncbi:hypothetical protein [Bacillus cereus]|uniref:Uncharacterized protein n=1 Tax=Bacillus cereus TaxID=1396 RepID=A0A2B9DKA4_BACCE|nr:hypothetical protein [Bacillus cereus]PGM89320.1 hypothetical protein CN958_24925 [Bacillus cereus]